MTVWGWRTLIAAFVDGRIDAATFHDRFFDGWHAEKGLHRWYPKAVEELFFTVEAFCPDPALRDPQSPWEASKAELRRDATKALIRLDHEHAVVGRIASLVGGTRRAIERLASQ